VYCWVRDKLNPVIKSNHSIDTERQGTRFADTIETDFHLDQDEYPVYLNEETCKIIQISGKRTHYNLDLVFSGTAKDKVVGELTFESVKNKKEKNLATQQIYEKLTNCNIVTKIMKDSDNFGEEKKVEKPKKLKSSKTTAKEKISTI
jgi:hypothetical protein